MNECKIAHGMSRGVSKRAEKEQKLAQQEVHVEENREKPNSQGITKLMIETDTDDPNLRRTRVTGQQRNPTPQWGLQSSAPQGG